MLSFTDAELQKKFCEGFSFYPFKSLEQHGTLIYKCYKGESNMQKIMDWCSREHDSSHYRTKIAKKLAHKDIVAAGELLLVLLEAGEWWKTRFPVDLQPDGKKLSGSIEQYHILLASYGQNVLQRIATKLAEEYHSFSTEYIQQIEDLMQAFMPHTDALHAFLKDSTSKRRNYAPRMLGEEDREYLTKVMLAVDAFRELQERNVYLLGAWKKQLALYNSRRAMN
ncbi:hypothetical protein [Chitinophaga cymbidii]|uniref:Uncharacterized protein n=1 Tax=Chitinophaga cymbidii TaxID=1096750 RepID=A0A512RJN1_9BACT|nr:hypothetical protein [Chitinophaga cymbidii]GEP95885.1 hypothetical protein CCY01nite_21450 [Chitinophaga cymbidii]